jgi:hypothetical protein
MRVTAEDIVALTSFPLLWRWTQESHAKLAPGELASIRPIRAAKVEALCAQIASRAVVSVGAEDHIDANGDTAAFAVRKWLDGKIPDGEGEVVVLWNRATAALVPRTLFIERWDDFWYPGSDDLTVMGVVGTWRIEMYHHGMFDFSASGAVDPGTGRSP